MAFKDKHSFVAIILPAFVIALSLTGCGTEDVYDLRDTAATENGLAVALGPETNGSALIYAAAPSVFTGITFCLLDQNSVCTATAVAMTFEQTVGDRKIFRSGTTKTLTNNSVWLFTAIDANGTKIEQKVRISESVTPNSGGSVVTGGLNWRVLLMASDQGNKGAWINAFDNARKKLKQIFTARGVPAANFRELSLHPDQQSTTVRPTSFANFEESLKSFGTPGSNDACIVHMTSHGSRDGFNIGSARLSPAQMNQALEAGCGNRPTVVLVSACFSGLYVLDSSNIKKPNRIILTAARHDVTSFGCSPENEYTYWDGCLIESLPTAAKWKDLAANVVSCITRKEGGSTASYPQTFIGTDVADLAIPK